MEALGLRLAMRGRSERPRRSVSASDTDDDDDTDVCVRFDSFGCGMGGTGPDEPWLSVVEAICDGLGYCVFGERGSSKG